MRHNCSCFIFSNLFRSLCRLLIFFCLTLTLAIHHCASSTFVPSPPLPLLLIPAGQQCSSSLVSIIIIQSVLLSTNCQHSTNACLAINAIFLFSSHNFSNLLGVLIISFSCSCFYLILPALYFRLIFYRPLFSFYRLLVVVSSRSVW